MDRHEQIQEAKRPWLREAFQAGIFSGDAGEFDLVALKAEARRRLREAQDGSES
jgi:hypothetical protein